MIKQEDVTIIIPHLGVTLEQQYSLRQCLKSLHETVPDIKIVIAVNGVSEARFSTIEPYSNATESGIMIEEQGQCKAVNAAAAIVDTPYILVTNDDMVYADGWFARLTDGLEDNWVGCISPQLVEPRPGAPTFQVKFFGGAGGDFDYKVWREWADQYHEFGEGETRTGFNLPFLISKDIWNLVNGYDINYDPWGSNSDSDLEYKIKLAGIQPMQNTKAIVYHFSQTSGTFEPQNASFYQRNFAVFKEKWGFDRTDNGIWEATFEIPGMPERVFYPHWEGFYKK